MLATSSERRIFEREEPRKFENNKDQKKFLHSESVRFFAQNKVNTKKIKKMKKSSLNISPVFGPKLREDQT